MKATGGQALVQALDAWGVDLVFGIPGVHTLSLYDALYGHPRIRHVTVRHEQGGGFMADGYARASGKVGVVFTTTGPAAVNALTPLGEAHAESSPVLLIASGPTEATVGKDLGTLHEMRDQFGSLVSVTGQGRRVRSVDEIPEAMAEAFTWLQRRRPRPYVLEVPLDVLAAESEIDPVSAELPPVTTPNKEEIESAAELIRAASRPLLLAGGGAQGAAAEVQALAERLGAPVALTSNGLGVLPADHPRFLGGAGAFRRRAEEADLLIAVGTRFGQHTVGSWKGSPTGLIHLDIDPTVIGRRYTPDVSLLGDACGGLRSLLEALGDGEGVSGWPSDLAAEGEVPDSDDDRLAFEILGVLRDRLSRDAVVTYDMTTVCYRVTRAFPVYTPRGLFGPSCYGSLGFAVPAAIGAKLACPGRQAVALCGDGASSLPPRSCPRHASSAWGSPSWSSTTTPMPRSVACRTAIARDATSVSSWRTPILASLRRASGSTRNGSRQPRPSGRRLPRPFRKIFRR